MASSRLSPLVLVLALAAAPAIAGCKCGSGPSESDGGAFDGGLNPGETCVSAVDCASDLTCDPDTNECAGGVPCTAHADCGLGAYCETNNECRTNTTGGPCDGDRNCTFSDTCMAGLCGCGGESFGATSVPPNILIVLDRSGSMDDNVMGTGMTKWEIAVTAINTLTSTYVNEIRFGLALYQGPNDCDPGQVFVDIDDTNITASMITSELNMTGPNGWTPIGDTLQALVGYAGLADMTRANYILLITDGMETCDGDGVAGATALANQTPTVSTFVVGFGDGVDPNALDAIATAGNTAIPGGPPFYYQADDPMSLSTAFGTIAGSVLSCVYTLSSVPPGVDELYIYFDSTLLPRDMSHADGWDYDISSNQLTFYGPACDALQNGTVMDLQIVHGCPIG